MKLTWDIHSIGGNWLASTTEKVRGRHWFVRITPGKTAFTSDSHATVFAQTCVLMSLCRIVENIDDCADDDKHHDRILEWLFPIMPYDAIKEPKDLNDCLVMAGILIVGQIDDNLSTDNSHVKPLVTVN